MEVSSESEAMNSSMLSSSKYPWRKKKTNVLVAYFNIQWKLCFISLTDKLTNMT
jgi:hypothetical protein